MSYLFFFPEDLTDIFLRLEPGGHQFVTAAQALEPEIRTGAQHLPTLLPTGMGLLHNQNIVQLNIHAYLPLMASQYCFAACSSLLGPYS